MLFLKGKTERNIEMKNIMFELIINNIYSINLTCGWSFFVFVLVTRRSIFFIYLLMMLMITIFFFLYAVVMLIPSNKYFYNISVFCHCIEMFSNFKNINLTNINSFLTAWSKTRNENSVDHADSTRTIFHSKDTFSLVKEHNIQNTAGYKLLQIAAIDFQMNHLTCARHNNTNMTNKRFRIFSNQTFCTTLLLLFSVSQSVSNVLFQQFEFGVYFSLSFSLYDFVNAS